MQPPKVIPHQPEAFHDIPLQGDPFDKIFKQASPSVEEVIRLPDYIEPQPDLHKILHGEAEAFVGQLAAHGFNALCAWCAVMYKPHAQSIGVMNEPVYSRG